MPTPYPKEFCADVVAVARQGDKSRAQVARSFGIAESCLARWLRIADRDDGADPTTVDLATQHVDRDALPHDHTEPRKARISAWTRSALGDLVYSGAVFAWSIVAFTILVTGIAVTASLSGQVSAYAQCPTVIVHA